LPGVIVGGKVLAESLAGAADRALSSGEGRILRRATLTIDDYTTMLSAYVSSLVAGNGISREPNGENMGITRAETLNTIEFAVHRAIHEFPPQK
jgi:hypothetical protein